MNKEFKVGDKVVSIGTIIKINEKEAYPIVVKFNDGIIGSYTERGVFAKTNPIQSLFHIEEFTFPSKLRKELFAIASMFPLFLHKHLDCADEKEQSSTKDIYELIEKELIRAKEIHPNYPLDRFVQFAIMQEEAGEVAKAVNDFHFGKGSLEDVKTELIQTAAMCVRMLETIK